MAAAPPMALDLSEQGSGTEVRVDMESGEKLDELGFPPIPGPDGEALVVDPGVDPERANAITEAALATDGESIVIEGPPDGQVTLIGGYVDALGARHVAAEVKELNGRDEEFIAKAAVGGDEVRYIDALLKVGVERLGEITERRELDKALDTLLAGDRDLLVLQIRRTTFGDTQELAIECPFCEAKFDVSYSYSSDVPLQGWKLAEEGVDPSQRVFDIEGPSGRAYEMRLVDGRAQKLIYTKENAQKTSAEVNTLLLKELLVSVNGTPVRSLDTIRELPAKDRAHLIKWLMKGEIGPQYEKVVQECPTCSREFPLVMTLRMMFRGE